MAAVEIDQALRVRAVLALPTGADLVTACRSVYGQHRPGEHLVGRRAAALAQLHRTQRIEPAKTELITARRSDLIDLIDQWAAVHARIVGGGFGAAADDLARAYVASGAKIHANSPVDSLDLHGSCRALARCVNAWDDLRAGHRKAIPWPQDLSGAVGER